MGDDSDHRVRGHAVDRMTSTCMGSSDDQGQVPGRECAGTSDMMKVQLPGLVGNYPPQGIQPVTS